MKQLKKVPQFILVLGLLLLAPGWLCGQGTAFTYQGRLFDNTNAANGLYALRFTLYDANNNLNVVGGPLPIAPVAVSNGLFVVTLDFGSSPNPFTGPARWLQMDSATNSASPIYIPMTPRQQLTPAPYAVFANTASNLSGTLPTAQLNGTVANNQLANNGITINPGAGLSGGGLVALGGSTSLTIPSGGVNNAMLANPSLTITAGAGLSGGGTVALGGSTMLANNGVFSVTGSADITASPSSGNVVLSDNATNANTFNTIVKRDGAGSFAAGNVTLDGNLNLPFTTGTIGIIYTGGSRFLHDYGAGNGNLFAGLNAGNFSLTGVGDTGLGSVTLLHDTSGSYNTAIGSLALNLNTSGSYNTANGYAALYNNTSGTDNTANGYGALYNNTSGTDNTANGAGALDDNTSGSNNTANGYQALVFNTSGSFNTANGAGALYENTSESNNTADGYEALFFNQADNNTAIGALALYNNTTGFENTANGCQALFTNTTGSDNTAIGFQALQANVGGEDQYGDSLGSYNTAVGSLALYNNTSGSYNTANGQGALFANNTGGANTANGAAALFNNTTGSYNTAIGFQALQDNTTGSHNTAIGYTALSSSYYAATNGSFNTAIGVYTLPFNSGSFNTAIGYSALQNNDTGTNNIALGASAGAYIDDGSNNIEIGCVGDADNGAIRIGTQGVQNNTFIAGIYGTTAAGVAVYVNLNGQLGNLTSSRRFKNDIQTMADASDVLLSLRPVTFRYKPEIDPKGTPQFGLVAEEVDKVDPDLVVRDNQHGIYTVRYEAVNAMLLNEFQKEHRKVETQDAEIQDLKQQLAATQKEMTARLSLLEKAVASITQKSTVALAAATGEK